VNKLNIRPAGKTGVNLYVWAKPQGAIFDVWATNYDTMRIAYVHTIDSNPLPQHLYRLADYLAWLACHRYISTQKTSPTYVNCYGTLRIVNLRHDPAFAFGK
jgi:hypothetical protein